MALMQEDDGVFAPVSSEPRRMMIEQVPTDGGAKFLRP
jgi:hypothetical protein